MHVLVLFFVLLIIRDNKLYDKYAPALRRDLGFSHNSPYFMCGDKKLEVMTLDSLDKKGIFYLAGLRDGNILVPRGKSTVPFYIRLEKARGSTIQINVVPGGDGPPLSERLRRTVEIAVPHSLE